MTDSIVSFTVIDGLPAIVGDCDISSVGEIKAWLASVIAEPVEIDLSCVTFFDAAAVATFVSLKRQHPSMVFVHPSRWVLRVLDITGTREQFLHDSR